MKPYPWLVALGLTCLTSAQSVDPSPTLEVNGPLITRLAEEARANQPGLKAASATVLASEHHAASIPTWDDPMMVLGGMAAEEVMRMDEGDILYGIEQRLPLFGRPRAARLSARSEHLVQERALELQFQELRRDLAKTLFRAALTATEHQIQTEDLHSIRQMIDLMRQRYRAGNGSLVEILKLQNEFATRSNQLVTLQKESEHQTVALNRILNRPLNQSWPRLTLPPLAPEIPFSELLLQLALRHEPKLAVLRAETQRAEAQVDETRRSRHPDISAGLQARNYSGTGEFRQAELMLRFSLPFLNRGRYQSALHRDRARLDAALHAVSDYELRVREEIHLLLTRIDSARREASLYQDELIPRTRQALDVAHAAFSTDDRVLAREAVDTRRMLVESRLMHARAVAEQYLELSELVLCCGLGDLEAVTNLKTP